MRKTRYRIVRDRWLGYEVQVWRWWWPKWTCAGFSNTHSSIERAERWLAGYRREFVKTCD